MEIVSFASLSEDNYIRHVRLLIYIVGIALFLEILTTSCVKENRLEVLVAYPTWNKNSVKPTLVQQMNIARSFGCTKAPAGS